MHCVKLPGQRLMARDFDHQVAEFQVRVSCWKFRDNEVRLHLHALAYNLATFLRCIALPEAMADWSLTSLQLKLIKPGPASSATPEQSPSNWLRWPSPARWCAPSSPPSADCERHRCARDHERESNRRKAAGQVRPWR